MTGKSKYNEPTPAAPAATTPAATAARGEMCTCGHLKIDHVADIQRWRDNTVVYYNEGHCKRCKCKYFAFAYPVILDYKNDEEEEAR